MDTTAALARNATEYMTKEERKVVFASSLGTAFEWYDFLVFASLSPVIASKFFAPLSPEIAFIFALLTFSAAYAVRPLGALFFGRIGDIVGRKYTFLVTVSLMGGATFLVGVLPTYASWGMAAPVILIVLRLLQGLSLGGEFGGAATYIAEHAPEDRRGFFASWINCTAAVGFILSLAVILATRALVGETQFAEWGWRVPFLLSLFLLLLTVWIRMNLAESPVFLKMKKEGTLTKSPLKEAFGDWKNIRLALAGMFGVVAGSAVVASMGLIYPLLFLTQTLKVDPFTVNILVGAAIVASVPLYPFVGWLSDRIGRKPPIVFGCLLAALTFFPAVKMLTHYANPAYEAALRSAPISVSADPSLCRFMFNPTGTAKFLSSCDIARNSLARAGVNYDNVSAPTGTMAVVKIGERVVPSFEGAGLDPVQFKQKSDAFNAALLAAIKEAGYPAKADPDQIRLGMVWLIVFYMAALVPLAMAAVSTIMVELFPARIRYTAMSLPYHLGNGWIAGFLTPAVFALVAASGNIYFGLWYPVFWALVGAFVTLVFVPETKNRVFRNWH
jgi:MFS family permease